MRKVVVTKEQKDPRGSDAREDITLKEFSQTLPSIRSRKHRVVGAELNSEV